MKNLNTLIFAGFEKILNCIPNIHQKIGGGTIKPPSDDKLLADGNNKGRNETIAVADIGYHKIVVFIARVNADEKIEIIGFGEEKAEGISKGIVSNIVKSSKCLKIAIDKAAAQANFIPKGIYASISCAVKTYDHQEILIRNNNVEISTEDIMKLKSFINQSGLYTNETVLYAEPIHFTVDGESGILSPVGMAGTTLEATFKVLTCPFVCIKNLKRCCNLIGISLTATYPAIIASAESVLHGEEKTEGVVLVDIGAEKSSIAIYKNDNLLYTETIPLGGKHVTNDICQYAGLFFKHAEEIKIKYGKAVYPILMIMKP